MGLRSPHLEQCHRYRRPRVVSNDALESIVATGTLARFGPHIVATSTVARFIPHIVAMGTLARFIPHTSKSIVPAPACQASSSRKVVLTGPLARTALD